jgi:ribosome-binding protein aMBF1 (putative translation factor)
MEHPSLNLHKKTVPQQTELNKLEETLQSLSKRSEALKQLPTHIIEVNTDTLTGSLKEIVERNNETIRLAVKELELSRGEFAQVLAGIEQVLAELKRKNSNLELEHEVLTKINKALP